MVIIDLGANDFYGGAFNPTIIGNDLKRIIGMIKMSSPETCILISNSQDIYKRRRNISGNNAIQILLINQHSESIFISQLKFQTELEQNRLIQLTSLPSRSALLRQLA